MTRMIDLC